MTVRQTLPLLAGAILGAALADAQTLLDLSTQVRNVDFTSATSTKPIRIGATLPLTCSRGEAFFLTSAAAGSNLQFCGATNSWVPQGGGTSQGSQTEAGPSVVRVDAVTLSLGANCSVGNYCNARIGGTAYTYVGGSTIVLGRGTPTIRIYISDGSDGATAGTIKVRNSAASGVSCSGGCVVENSQTTFPGQSIPLAIWTSTSDGLWDTSGQDLRSALSTGQNAIAGQGISISQGSSTSISVDTTVIPRKFAGTGPPGNIALSSLGDFYNDVTNSNTYQCFNSTACTVVGPGQWIKIVAASGTLNATGVPKEFSGNGPPHVVSSSVLGDFYSDIVNNHTYQCFNSGPCTATGTGNWIRIDSSTGSGALSPTIVDGIYVAYNGVNYFPLAASNGLPDATSFVWMNQPAGATQTVVGSHAIHLAAAGPAGNGNNLSILQDPTVLSSSAFDIRAAFSGCAVPTAIDGSLCAIGLTDGTKVVSFGLTYIYGSHALAVLDWNNAATLVGVSMQARQPLPQVMALRIVLSAGVLTFYYSVDGGTSYEPVLSGYLVTFFPGSPGLNAAWMINNNWTSGISSATLVDWKIN